MKFSGTLQKWQQLLWNVNKSVNSKLDLNDDLAAIFEDKFTFNRHVRDLMLLLLKNQCYAYNLVFDHCLFEKEHIAYKIGNETVNVFYSCCHHLRFAQT